MNAVLEDRPNQAAPASFGELRQALAFVTDQYGRLAQSGESVLEWLWEALQGDFNQQRSGSQIAFDTAISMIPVVDQICDVRDIIANCRQIRDDVRNTWAWVGLVLTLIGLFPTLGSLVKGVLKIFFLFVRRHGLNHVTKAVDEAMTWVITLLRKREVQKYLRGLRWDQVFGELARQIRVVRGQVNTRMLMSAFDRGIALMNNLLGRARRIPWVGSKAQEAIDMVLSVRRQADQYLEQALRPVQQVLNVIIRRLELEDLAQRRGIVNARNVHFRGQLPQSRAVTLMRESNPPPPWLSVGKPGRFAPLQDRKIMAEVERKAQEGYPRLTEDEVMTFAKGMRTDTLRGPLKLYRVVSPGNQAAASDWMTEEVWQQINRASSPKTAWRKHLAVWPDWNANGQFVMYELKAGEELKVWRGPAASQVRKNTNLPDLYLEGGYEQIKFDGSQVRTAQGQAVRQARDSSQIHRIDPASGHMTPTDMSWDQYRRLPEAEQERYTSLRTGINHPSIHGPFETGWGYTDFDPQLRDVRLGLPNLPGQVTQIRK